MLIFITLCFWAGCIRSPWWLPFFFGGVALIFVTAMNFGVPDLRVIAHQFGSVLIFYVPAFWLGRGVAELVQRRKHRKTHLPLTPII